MADKLRGSYATDSGMHCIWDPASFSAIHDYDTWETELLADKDIRRHIQAGHFVPVNIQSDGVFNIEVRVGSAEEPSALSDREAEYLVVSSEPYLFASNGALCVSGIEHVEGQPSDTVGSLDLASGEYAVTVHLIGWDEEPGMVAEDGTPKPEALPDFVVLVNPLAGDVSFRTEVETFDQPE